MGRRKGTRQVKGPSKSHASRPLFSPDGTDNGTVDTVSRNGSPRGDQTDVLSSTTLNLESTSENSGSMRKKFAVPMLSKASRKDVAAAILERSSMNSSEKHPDSVLPSVSSPSSNITTTKVALQTSSTLPSVSTTVLLSHPSANGLHQRQHTRRAPVETSKNIENFTKSMSNVHPMESLDELWRPETNIADAMAYVFRLPTRSIERENAYNTMILRFLPFLEHTNQKQGVLLVCFCLCVCNQSNRSS